MEAQRPILEPLCVALLQKAFSATTKSGLMTFITRRKSTQVSDRHLRRAGPQARLRPSSSSAGAHQGLLDDLMRIVTET